MVEVEVMPSALKDIKNIIEYVHKQSVQNAEKLYVEIKEKINPQLREVKLHRLRIIYKSTDTKVQVLTVHHSAGLLINNPHLKDLF